MAAAFVEAGRPTNAVERSQQLVEVAPLREQHRATLIDPLVAAGRTADAMRADQRQRAVLAEAGV